MKRMHIHVGVDNLAQSIQFYTSIFGVEPSKLKENYAKWMLENPRMNFAISTMSDKKGINHLGFQVDSKEELSSLRESLKKADLSTFDEGETVCCYARSDKSWVQDPSGIAWEMYHSMEDVELFLAENHSEKNSGCSTDKKCAGAACN